MASKTTRGKEPVGYRRASRSEMAARPINPEPNADGTYDFEGHRAVGYIRASVNETDEMGFGIERQRDLISKYCDAHDLVIVGWYIDSDSMGKPMTYSALNGLMYHGAKSPAVNYVVCARADRMAPDIYTYYYYVMFFARKGIELVTALERSANFGVKDNDITLSDEFNTLVHLIADTERSNVGKRISARTLLSGSGWYSGGRAPYGYELSGGRLVIVPSEADVVRRVFYLYTHGVSVIGIHAYLANAGYVSRMARPISIGMITRMLDREPLYRGYCRTKSMDWVKGQHESILDGTIPPFITEGIVDTDKPDDADNADNADDTDNTDTE